MILLFNEVKYEYDIRGLITAFWPGINVETKVLGEPEAEVYAEAETGNLKAEVRAEALNGNLKADTKAEAGDMNPGNQGADVENQTPDCGKSEAEGARIVDILTVCYKEDGIFLTAKTRDGNIREVSVLSRDIPDNEKNALKRMTYRLFAEITGERKPWGTLTGIRPIKLPMALIEEGKGDAEIAEHLKKTYLIGDEKCDLSIGIAHREKRLLDVLDYEDGYSLYVGIPFCPTTCLYCSFTSYPLHKWEKRMGEYLDALEKEFKYVERHFAGKKLNTIYFGGGTPTTLAPEYLDRVLSEITNHFDLSHLKEWTVEGGRPDSITPEKLRVLRKYPVDRISINPQTMNQKTLDIIGRRHTVEDVRNAFSMAREEGFDNINMDLIIGLPEERIDDVKYTMEEIEKLNPDNLTVHTLAIKRASRLNMEKENYGSLFLEQDTTRMMEICSEGAARMNMKPYYLYRQKNMSGNLENVGFARDGKEGIYNILIMEEKQSIVALGAGSVSKRVDKDGLIERASNVKSIEQYLERVDEMVARKEELYGGN